MPDREMRSCHRRQLFGGGPHFRETGAARRLGRCHDGALDDRRIAEHHPASPLLGKHLDRHFAVGFRAAQIDQNGNTARGPCLLDRLQNALHVRAEPAFGVAAAMRDLDLVADHLTHHLRGPPGDVGRVRNDDQRNVLAHFHPSKKRDNASIMISLERAPGSMWPMLRSPRKEARPLVARIGTVAAAPLVAALRSRAPSSGPPPPAAPRAGTSTPSIAFSPEVDLPRADTAVTPAASNSGSSATVAGRSPSCLPMAIKKLP